jgi:outer membrane protein OmpA-like peptidoglycan-associated protein
MGTETQLDRFLACTSDAMWRAKMKVMRGLSIGMLGLACGGVLLAMSLGSEPATAQRACTPSTTASQWSPVIVSFDTGSVKISSPDQQKIANAAKLAKDNYIQQICVTGFADKQGDAKMNQLLSQRRAEAVAAELRKNGIAQNTVVVNGAGEPGGSAFGSFSGTSASSTADRRVEIRFAR